MPPNVVKTTDLRHNPNPVDPDVKVPAAVTRAKEAAERAQREAYPDQVPEPPAATPPVTKDGITIAPPVTPPGNPPAPAPSPAPVASAPAPAPVPEETWEHKFNSERGRHNQTKQLLQDTTNRVTALENLVAEMRTVQPATPTPAPAPTPAQRLVSEQEENEFGTEMLDVMGRRAREIVSPELTALRTEMQSLADRLNGTTKTIAKTSQRDMLARLDQAMPEWREINVLDEFKAWLALPDPYFGVRRHNALNAAYEQNDTPRVLAFFKGFVSELAATTPADDPAPRTPAPAAPVKPGLESLAAPGRARTPAHTNVPAEKQIITTADINAFYAAKARGLYDGREAEFSALEAELFQAQREGRVRPT